MAPTRLGADAHASISVLHPSVKRRERQLPTRYSDTNSLWRAARAVIRATLHVYLVVLVAWGVAQNLYLVSLLTTTEWHDFLQNLTCSTPDCTQSTKLETGVLIWHIALQLLLGVSLVAAPALSTWRWLALKRRSRNKQNGISGPERHSHSGRVAGGAWFIAQCCALTCLVLGEWPTLPALASVLNTLARAGAWCNPSSPNPTLLVEPISDAFSARAAKALLLPFQGSVDSSWGPEALLLATGSPTSPGGLPAGAGTQGLPLCLDDSFGAALQASALLAIMTGAALLLWLLVLAAFPVGLLVAPLAIAMLLSRPLSASAVFAQLQLSTGPSPSAFPSNSPASHESPTALALANFVLAAMTSALALGISLLIMLPALQRRLRGSGRAAAAPHKEPHHTLPLPTSHAPAEPTTPTRHRPGNLRTAAPSGPASNGPAAPSDTSPGSSQALMESECSSVSPILLSPQPQAAAASSSPTTAAAAATTAAAATAAAATAAAYTAAAAAPLAQGPRSAAPLAKHGSFLVPSHDRSLTSVQLSGRETSPGAHTPHLGQRQAPLEAAVWPGPAYRGFGAEADAAQRNTQHVGVVYTGAQDSDTRGGGCSDDMGGGFPGKGAVGKDHGVVGGRKTDEDVTEQADQSRSKRGRGGKLPMGLAGWLGRRRTAAHDGLLGSPDLERGGADGGGAGGREGTGGGAQGAAEGGERGRGGMSGPEKAGVREAGSASGAEGHEPIAPPPAVAFWDALPIIGWAARKGRAAPGGGGLQGLSEAPKSHATHDPVPSIAPPAAPTAGAAPEAALAGCPHGGGTSAAVGQLQPLCFDQELLAAGLDRGQVPSQRRPSTQSGGGAREQGWGADPSAASLLAKPEAAATSMVPPAHLPAGSPPPVPKGKRAWASPQPACTHAAAGPQAASNAGTESGPGTDPCGRPGAGTPGLALSSAADATAAVSALFPEQGIRSARIDLGGEMADRGARRGARSGRMRWATQPAEVQVLELEEPDQADSREECQPTQARMWAKPGPQPVAHSCATELSEVPVQGGDAAALAPHFQAQAPRQPVAKSSWHRRSAKSPGMARVGPTATARAKAWASPAKAQGRPIAKAWAGAWASPAKAQGVVMTRLRAETGAWASPAKAQGGPTGVARASAWASPAKAQGVLMTRVRAGAGASPAKAEGRLSGKARAWAWTSPAKAQARLPHNPAASGHGPPAAGAAFMPPPPPSAPAPPPSAPEPPRVGSDEGAGRGQQAPDGGAWVQVVEVRPASGASHPPADHLGNSPSAIARLTTRQSPEQAAVQQAVHQTVQQVAVQQAAVPQAAAPQPQVVQARSLVRWKSVTHGGAPEGGRRQQALPALSSGDVGSAPGPQGHTGLRFLEVWGHGLSAEPLAGSGQELLGRPEHQGSRQRWGQSQAQAPGQTRAPSQDQARGQGRTAVLEKRAGQDGRLGHAKGRVSEISPAACSPQGSGRPELGDVERDADQQGTKGRLGGRGRHAHGWAGVWGKGEGQAEEQKGGVAPRERTLRGDRGSGSFLQERGVGQGRSAGSQGREWLVTDGGVLGSGKARIMELLHLPRGRPGDQDLELGEGEGWEDDQGRGVLRRPAPGAHTRRELFGEGGAAGRGRGRGGGEGGVRSGESWSSGGSGSSGSSWSDTAGMLAAAHNGDDAGEEEGGLHTDVGGAAHGSGPEWGRARNGGRGDPGAGGARATRAAAVRLRTGCGLVLAWMLVAWSLAALGLSCAAFSAVKDTGYPGGDGSGNSAYATADVVCAAVMAASALAGAVWALPCGVRCKGRGREGGSANAVHPIC